MTLLLQMPPTFTAAHPSISGVTHSYCLVRMKHRARFPYSRWFKGLKKKKIRLL